MKFYKYNNTNKIMEKQNWRKNLDKTIEISLNNLIKETQKHDSAIKNSDDKSKAQIWIGMAILNHKLDLLLNLKAQNNKKSEEKKKTEIKPEIKTEKKIETKTKSNPLSSKTIDKKIDKNQTLLSDIKNENKIKKGEIKKIIKNLESF